MNRLTTGFIRGDWIAARRIDIAFCPPGFSKRATTDLFRSDGMSLVELIIPAESAHLGELRLLQFKDVSCRCLSR